MQADARWPDAANGCRRSFTVQSAVGADIREALANAVVKGGFGLMELRPAHLEPGGDLPAADDQRHDGRGSGGVRNVWAVATRELRSYFLSPTGLRGHRACSCSGAGYLFGLILESSREASLRGLISNVSVLFLFVVPMISMRLLAEEQRTGTIELLLTNPVQEWQIVAGKFIASVLLVLVMVGLDADVPAVPVRLRQPRPRPDRHRLCRRDAAGGGVPGGRPVGVEPD